MNSATLPEPIARDFWRAPAVADDEKILFDEPGRILSKISCVDETEGAVDCCSHHFRVTKPEFGFYTLRVKHGGGEESWQLTYDSRMIAGLAQMESDFRFVLLWTIMDAHHKSAERAAGKVNAEWQRAAVEKRIKTRKLPGKNAVKVWIEPAKTAQAAPATL